MGFKKLISSFNKFSTTRRKKRRIKGQKKYTRRRVIRGG